MSCDALPSILRPRPRGKGKEYNLLGLPNTSDITDSSSPRQEVDLEWSTSNSTGEFCFFLGISGPNWWTSPGKKCISSHAGGIFSTLHKRLLGRN
ncbi:Uncharacterized protein FKW44_014323 [Caligus rogercresseyi]|uniref:Uncharacterized protein n=1 Tax=Caligus rogercresseyi TaxID=217165 RepID=A0A7T8GZM6_CALRO|nr:Uncharacterized protein FKW44_014323 [Caligus rogercresseyi]